MAWQDNMTIDPGWNRPYIDDDDLIPRRIKTLRTKIVEKKLVCAFNGNVYIFLPISNVWSILCSDEATIFLNSVMEMESATVNYAQAFRPYVSFLERNAVENLASNSPTSICMGTTRLRVTREGDTLTLSECEAILPQLTTQHAAIASLCFMPLSTKCWPTRWYRTDDMPMYRFLAPLFVDGETELKTIEWVCGNSLLDPSNVSKALVLYGEGGTGKTTVLALIKIALMGCCGSIPDKALVGLAKGMSNEVASIVVSNRIVTAGDVGGIDDSTNLSVIKSLTGHDYISIPPLTARSSCSLIYTTNRLDDPRKNKEWATTAIMRRVVVVSMQADALSLAEQSIPQDAVSRIDFALRCVHTRLIHPHMPVSPMSVVLTIAGSVSHDIFPYLTEITDSDIVDEERVDVLSIIAGAIGITSHQVGELARKISPAAVIMVKSTYCLIGVAPTSRYYEMVA